ASSDAVNAAIRKAAGELGAQFSAEFPPDKTKECDYTVACVNKALDELLADHAVDVVIAQGVLASNLAVQRTELAKPLLAPFVVDLELQQLPKQIVRKNLSYVVWSPDWARDLKAFQKFAKFTKLGVVVDKLLLDALPLLQKSVEKAGTTAGVPVVVVPIADTAQSALDVLPKDVDALYITALRRISEDELKKLAQGLRDKRLPSFSFAGEAGVKLGFLAGMGANDDVVQLARRTALNLRGLVLGDPPDTLLTAFQQSEQLYFNAEVARAIGVVPESAVLLDVTTVGTLAGQTGRSLTLADAVKEAMKANLDLAASKEGLLSTAEQVNQARSALLPQLGVGVGARWIDEDRTLLYGAERSASWSAQLRQTIYDERSWGSFTTEKHLQRARERNQDAFRLDVVLSVALAYLDLLRTQTAINVQKQDLALSRSNLELARVREKVGVGGREEVYRWEAQVANAQNRLLATVAISRAARVELNTLLNRPSEQAVVPKELAIDDSSLLTSGKKLNRYLEDPNLFAVLSDFMTQESHRLAPELASVDASLAAATRSVTAEKRSYVLPTFVATAGIEQRFYEAGAGSDPQPIAGIETPDSLDWQVGVSASLPLLEGGGHNAELRRVERQRGQLTLQRKSIARDIERRLRVSLYQANATFGAIALTRAAATAAGQNLDLVTDKYREGTAPIIQLIDAQNQSVVAELDAANAVFEFLAQLMRVERSMGRFSFLVNPDQTSDFFRRLEDYSRRAAQGTRAPR
ncbi:MAG TPA: TolC family protein, partial [Polyangiaceae bacterium]